MSNKSKLELTWIGKHDEPRLEPRILLEDPVLSYHADQRTDLFYYNLPQAFQKVYSQIIAAPNFNEVDLSAGNKAYSCGMILYQKFLQGREEDFLQNEQAENSVSVQGKLSKASFLQWFAPLVQALKEHGNSATPEKARQKIIENCDLSEDVVNETRGKNGQKKFDNEVAWARNYLVYENIIDKKAERGIWRLTDKGKQVKMTHELASQIFFKWVKKPVTPKEEYHFAGLTWCRENLCG